MRKFKQIIGGTQEEAYAKFSWLKEADFEDAVVDIRNSCLIWIDGIWNKGIWEYGGWQNGTWIKGKMWSSIKQDYVRVKCWDIDKKEFILE